MTTVAGHDATIVVDNFAGEEMDVNVTVSKAPKDNVTYWTVETEPGNGKDDEWSVTYEVKKDEKETGKWIFTKSKNDDRGE
jgi:hypothetical protein